MKIHAASSDHTHDIPCHVFRGLLKVYFAFLDEIVANPDKANWNVLHAMATVAEYLEQSTPPHSDETPTNEARLN